MSMSRAGKRDRKATARPGRKTVLVTGGGLVSVYVYVVLFGIGYGGVIVLMPAIVLNYYGAENSASITGLAMLLHTLPSAVGAPLIGTMKDVSSSYVPAFGLMIGIGVAGALSAFLARPPEHESVEAKDRILQSST